MGWENRGNGRYYYRKKRIGSKVVSEYVGNGVLAEIAENLDKSEQAKRIDKHKQEKQSLEQVININRIMNKVENEIKILAKVYLLMNGFHTHKGTWRKKRNEK